MNIEEIRKYILSLPGAEETNPFSEDTEIAVYRVAGKWFAVFMFGRPEWLTVKCDPDRATVLRDCYDAIAPAWHFNKRHWNALRFESLPADIVRREIRHSYMCVIKKNVTPKAARLKLLSMATGAGITDAEPIE